MPTAPAPCPVGGERALTPGEVTLASSVFGDAVDLARVTIRRRKFFPLQPRKVTMAPRGHIHFHPLGSAYCDDFASASLARRALFVHEMTHVWQTQTRGEFYLVLHRHPWCRYDYALKPGWTLDRYGIEQQAMIVQHAYMLRQGGIVAGAPPLAQYLSVLPFDSALTA
ncbi:vgr related protein [Aurantiacibacter xanthus]|uniref:Vgr related protein n=1 Tax=Aurantiacibacter xanthus TaxID=1784712 RepID=A0A3A1PDR3_9SPHN|nr:vgr related protein [Aurantiacibacter xanthus]RIV91900.1 vgr related protein [Aurantiacibacter xanthus]